MLNDVLCSFLFPLPIIIAIAVVGTLVGCVLKYFNAELPAKVIKWSMLLMGSLTLTGSIFTALWSRWVYGNLYSHFDYIPGLDCSPFWLLIDYGPESPGQYYHGMTKGSIYALWTIYVILCWGSAIGMTVFIMNRLKNEKK